MERNVPHERSARQQLLDLACEVSLYRVIGGRYFYDLAKRAVEVAHAAAREGVPLITPLVELFVDQREKYGGGETLGWYYRRAYGRSDAGLDPLRFFAISYSNNFVSIESLGVAGAGGEIRLNDRSVDEIFGCAENDSPRSYSRWADDEHPVGGAPLLLRMDRGENHFGQLRLEAEDLHPCRGELHLGDPSQESEQLAAFCRMEPLVREMFARQAPTDAQRVEAKERATAIIGSANSFCFFPDSGYCFSCGGDVTVGISDRSAAAARTGCNLCGRTWCD
jgi:hypothetical protein